MTSLVARDLAGVCGGKFFPTCDEAQRRADAYGAEAANAQGHIDRGQHPWVFKLVRHRARGDQHRAQVSADWICGRKK